jgi:DNA-binding LacI/PurR family transcriptional regulator
MAEHGISTGAYNLPDWEEDLGGFHRLLHNLFQHTPPTALVVDESIFLVATMLFLQSRGLQVPKDVSLICTDGDPRTSRGAVRRSPTSIGTPPRPARLSSWAGGAAVIDAASRLVGPGSEPVAEFRICRV